VRWRPTIHSEGSRLASITIGALAVGCVVLSVSAPGASAGGFSPNDFHFSCEAGERAQPSHGAERRYGEGASFTRSWLILGCARHPNTGFEVQVMGQVDSRPICLYAVSRENRSSPSKLTSGGAACGPPGRQPRAGPESTLRALGAGKGPAGHRSVFGIADGAVRSVRVAEPGAPWTWPAAAMRGRSRGFVLSRENSAGPEVMRRSRRARPFTAFISFVPTWAFACGTFDVIGFDAVGRPIARQRFASGAGHYFGAAPQACELGSDPAFRAALLGILASAVVS